MSKNPYNPYKKKKANSDALVPLGDDGPCTFRQGNPHCLCKGCREFLELHAFSSMRSTVNSTPPVPPATTVPNYASLQTPTVPRHRLKTPPSSTTRASYAPTFTPPEPVQEFPTDFGIDGSVTDADILEDGYDTTTAPTAITPPRRAGYTYDSPIINNIFSPIIPSGDERALVEVRKFCRQLKDVLIEMQFMQAKNHSLDDQPTKFVPNNPYANQALRELQSLGIEEDMVVSSTETLFSPTVHQCLLGPMRHIGVYRLSTANNFCPMKENSNGGAGTRIFDYNHKGCFFFSPVMIREGSASMFNAKNEFEFFEGANGVKQYNTRYWSGNLQVKRKQGGDPFHTLEIGASIPEWTVADQFKDKHQDGLIWMATNGAVMSNKKSFYLSMKNEYATVFLKNMKSQLMGKARLAGFLPLFLMKNAIVQRTSHFGINGHQITTINIKPKSYLALAGFFKGSGDDLQLIVLKNQEDNFMVLADDNNH